VAPARIVCRIDQPNAAPPFLCGQANSELFRFVPELLRRDEFLIDLFLGTAAPPREPMLGLRSRREQIVHSSDRDRVPRIR
jgi:hypothetical protein